MHLLKWPQRPSSPYILGAVLTYVLCMLTAGRVFCAGECWNILVAGIGAGILWVFVFWGHGIMQFLTCLLVRRIWKSGRAYEFLVLNAPMLLLVLYFAVEPVYSPKGVFDFFVASPRPKSLRITRYGALHGIGEPGRMGLAFEVQPAEFGMIVRNGEFVLSRDPTNEHVLWLNRMHIAGGCFTVNWELVPLHYASKQSFRHLFASSNLSSGYLFYCGEPERLLKDEDVHPDEPR